MKLIWSPKAQRDYLYWRQTDKKIADKINILIKSINKSPFYGIGKPELLKADFSGCWSRKINREHRLIYYIKNNTINIVACRFHYE